MKSVKEVKGIFDGIAILKVKVKETIITCTQIYASTSTAEEEEVEKFYEVVEEVTQEKTKSRGSILHLMGDWISQIGQRQKIEYETLGRFGYGTRNRRGWRLLRFCQEFNLKIVRKLSAREMAV